MNVKQYQQTLKDIKQILGDKQDEFDVDVTVDNLKELNVTTKVQTTTKVQKVQVEEVQKVQVGEVQKVQVEEVQKVQVEEVHEKFWYLMNGTKFPTPAKVDEVTKKRITKLMPSEDVEGDRIEEQLMFVPPNYEQIKQERKLKTILLYNGLHAWNVEQGEVV
jgi:hypothetical protein